MYKSSNYNLIINSKNSDEIIIFNTLYGSLTIFTKDEFSLAKVYLKNPTKFKQDDIKMTLICQKHLIRDNINELSIIRKRKELGMADKNRLDIIIMPTMECNFSCIYCYEVDKVGKMNDRTQESIKNWMKAEIPKYKIVMLSWFGGEPLMNYKKIIEITSFAKNICKKQNIVLINHITTNGYALSEDLAEKLFEVGIMDYQITVDGTNETHNKLRPLKNGKGTFDKIFNNIILLLSHNKSIKVTLRINFNHTNIHEIPNLLKLFPAEYRQQLRISFEPIFGSCEYNAIDNIANSEMSEALANYYQIAKELGYDISIGQSVIQTGKLVYCYAERENQLIINFNGDVFKCSVNCFDTTNRLGNINQDGILIKEKWDEWMQMPLFDEACCQCKYLPLCMGGCRKTRVKNNNSDCKCNLVPTNASYVLKQISLKGFENLIIAEN